MFAALEGKLSSLITTCTPLWRAHCRAKNIPIKRDKKARKAGGGWAKLRASVKKGAEGDGGAGLPKIARELLISVAEAGMSIEVCFQLLFTAGDNFRVWCGRMYPRLASRKSEGC